MEQDDWVQYGYDYCTNNLNLFRGAIKQPIVQAHLITTEAINKGRSEDNKIREFGGWVFLTADGEYWTDVEGKFGTIRMVRIETDNIEEAKATAMMLWRMEA